MAEFKVGDEVIIRGTVVSIDTDRDDLYPVQVRLTGTKGRYDLGFTKDGKYDEESDAPNLFHLSELESGDSKHLRDEIDNLKHELAQTKDYYSDLENEVKSLRAEKATFTEECGKVTLENDTLRNMGNDTTSNSSPDRDLIIKLEAQVEILKQLLIEIHETKNCK